jgi:uncharacterized protein (TIGR02300 family)
MSNAQAKSAALKLGTKRTCPSCSTKFYDFERHPIVCPKCHGKVEETATAPILKSAPEKKEKPTKVGPEAILLQDDDTSPEESDIFDSADDLGGDDDVVDDIEVDDDEDDETY